MSNAEFAISGKTAQVVDSSGEKVTILDLGPRTCLNPKETGRYGMASIHIDVYDAPFDDGALIAPLIVNAKLLCDVTAGTDGNGERFTIDITRGGILAVGGCDSIHLAAYYRRADGAALPIIARPKQVLATVAWPTSISPKASCVTGDTIAIPAPVPPAVEVVTGFFPIPRQAQSVMVLSPTPAALATLTIELAQSAVSPIAYATLNPNVTGTPIAHGVEVYRFRSPVAMSAIAFFELWP